ncbi:D-alanyl-D-alanine endopeptidase [Sediminicurvatus halobius]|uniref:D-alanyl-D-alanine endopeptidase n=1 Tax=Sediminicurvatus halobius TaxID=2182432 RepID=A0A2U2N8X9_9GAMM|nr:D-alanyl-D-alanine endopeptidase [Spiribacter halobius]PWG65557.1 D-alanyl-D-alanine endopeptidase [Spiribacter halobius]UEX76468.1 D-alanyl-D-alanine endopeptidase [Spiribacter halobius]
MLTRWFCLGILCLILSLPAGGHERPDPGSLQLASVHAAVAVLGEDRPLYEKRADVAVPIASLTKLMTAYVVLESGAALDEWLTVVPREQTPAKNAYSRIRIGSRLQRGELLRLALMSSENLAAHVLAAHHPGGRKGFVAAMNEAAQRLGMTRSRFVDPSGLSPDNRASARDLLRLVNAAHAYPEIREYSTTPARTARFRGPRYTLGYGNTNPLVHRAGWRVTLSKTGYLNESGRCLVMVANPGGRPLAMVFLNSFGSRTPIGDAGRVRRWLETGEGGSVAGAALEYERRRAAALKSTRPAAEGPESMSRR